MAWAFSPISKNLQHSQFSLGQMAESLVEDYAELGEGPTLYEQYVSF